MTLAKTQRTPSSRNRKKIFFAVLASWRENLCRVCLVEHFIGKNLSHVTGADGLAGQCSRPQSLICFTKREISPRRARKTQREIKLYRIRGLNPRVRPKGESCRFSPLETPSALCPPQEAGFTLNQITRIPRGKPRGYPITK